MSVVTVNVRGQSVPVSVYTANISGVRALVAADLSVDVASRASKSANLSDLTDPAAALGNLSALQSAIGAVARPADEKLQDDVSVFDFMSAAQIADVQARTLSLDVAAPIQAAVNHAILTGKNIHFPAGNYLVGTQITGYASSYTGAFAKALRLFGEGMLATTITSTIANGYIFDFDTTDPHTSLFRAILGLEVSNMTLKQSGSPAVSGGIQVQACYHVLFQHLHVDGFTGTGIKILCEYGDLDGSVYVKTDNVRIENCLVWGFDCAANSGHNEISYVSCEDTFIQACGVDAARAITGITKANPAVVTAAAHGYSNGDIVYIAGVGGMTEVNTQTANVAYTVAGATTDTFQLSGIDSTAYGTFSTGAKTITGVTRANPAVVTSVAHGFSNGQIVTIAGVAGMTQLNGVTYTVAGATADTFQLSGVNSTAYTAYSSGGTATPPSGHVLAANPTSGGMRWKGQILYTKNLAFTICENVSLFIRGQAGGGQDVVMDGFTAENSIRIGVLITGGTNIRVSLGQSYTNQAVSGGRMAYFGVMMDGTGFSIANVLLENIRVRTTSSDNRFRMFQVVGGNADTATIRIRDTLWQLFGASGQSRFSPNILFDPVPQQCVLRAVDATNLKLSPDLYNSKGSSSPYRLAYGGLGTNTDGEWTARSITSVTATNSGLSANTTYNVYLYDNVNVPALELSTTAVTNDTGSGYPVKTGEPHKLFVGVVRTDGSSQFTTTGTNWTNPLQISSDYPGNASWMWHSEADRKLRIQNGPTRPSSIADGQYEYWPAFETSSASFNPPSLAAGASSTSDITVACGAGDFCIGVGFATGWGGLTVTGCVKAANTVTVTMTNNTGSTIDLAATTAYVLIVKR